MNFLNKITEPALLFDKRKCLMNIRRMKQKADKNNVQFRPHFKTHQSVEI
jgi:D-serine deaminase-like pyridoxal phosphate-dependent protein